MNKKCDIYILEPNLDNRKPIAQLLVLSKFVIKFLSTPDELLKEVGKKIPHVVLINLDIKSINYKLTLAQLKLPQETLQIGLSSKYKADNPSPYKEFGLNEIWELPLAGLKIKPRINEILERIEPISVKLNSPVIVHSRVDGEIIAMGETDFVVKFPIKLPYGTKLDVKSELLSKLFKGEEKTFIVTENKHGELTAHQISVTILGLKNEDLRRIREMVINWEKL